ncbi:Serum paraoxonase/arylesterase 1 [Entomortierella chlamydospora]|uniref:Serum paraoxonase/arylesterase 1 n=1 Tax=Entomortierella chlamydospora TaxID=101097 RepID=A0A9P6MWM6_9FUNG|nr:Serum paraoxonase/arylesterase 1 [Entomortierella chlamydospora]KAG0016267.1 Serum paraoxonase/arylesterase 1 [Entomortierella chlamydospora]
MADKADTQASSEATLRNRKTTVEDADDSDTSPVASTTATSIAPSAASISKKGASSTQNDSEDSDKKKKAAANQIRRRQQQQQQPQKASRVRSILFSLLIATLGVLLKSAYDKLAPGRAITITQTEQLQGNCYRTACKFHKPLAPFAFTSLHDLSSDIDDLFNELECQLVIPGPSDIEIDDQDEIAFVSSDDRSWVKDSSYFHRPSQKTKENGGIYTISLTEKNGPLKEAKLQGYPSDDFHPAGMSLYRFQDSDTQAWVSRLFVINHSHKGDLVEVFDYSPKTNTLTFVKTIQSHLFTAPRDIVAIDKERFYLANNHYLGVKAGRIFEDVGGFAWGSVVYYNGDEIYEILGSLDNPYGIAASPDSSQIYVSSFMQKNVLVYNTTGDIVTGELVRDVKIWIGSHVDNLSVDKRTGDIYVASHPSYSTYLRHKLGYEPQSPSHVVKIEKLSPENFIPQENTDPELYFFPKIELPPLKWEVKDLFYSNGEDISASTVAAFWNNELILGSSTSHHLLRCTLRPDQ